MFCGSELKIVHLFVMQEILGDETEMEGEVLEFVMKHLRRRKRDSEKKISSLKKWLVNKLKIHGFDASLCQTSCPAGDSLSLSLSL